MQHSYRAVAATLILAAVPAFASAQTPGVRPLRLGAQATLITEGTTLGVGARVESNLASMVPSLPSLRAVGSFDIYFPGGGTFWELNAGAVYGFSAMSGGAATPYAGGGLSIVEGGTAGLNVMGGIRLRSMGAMDPYVEARLRLGNGTTLLITGGLLLW